MDKVAEVFLLLVLIIAAVDDMGTRQVHLFYVGGFFLGAVLIQILSPGLSWPSFLGGIGFGIALYISCTINKTVMGSGDACILCLCGAYLGLGDTMVLFFRAVMIAGTWGIMMILKSYLTMGKVHGRMELPFVPFLLCAYLSILV